MNNINLEQEPHELVHSYIIDSAEDVSCLDYDNPDYDNPDYDLIIKIGEVKIHVGYSDRKYNLHIQEVYENGKLTKLNKQYDNHNKLLHDYDLVKNLAEYDEDNSYHFIIRKYREMLKIENKIDSIPAILTSVTIAILLYNQFNTVLLWILFIFVGWVVIYDVMNWLEKLIMNRYGDYI